MAQEGLTPHWQSLSRLPTMGDWMEREFCDAEEHYDTLLRIRGLPHVPDDATVNRSIMLTTKRPALLPIQHAQLDRWRRTGACERARGEIDRLAGQLSRWDGILSASLALAAELSQGTSDSILGKGNVGLALDFLHGKYKYASYCPTSLCG